MRNETKVQKEILKFLQDNEIFAWRVNNMGVPDPHCKGGWRKQTGYNMPGMSDIIGIYRGKFLAIEVKAPGRKKNVSDNQVNFIERVLKEDGVAFVAESVEDVKKNLTGVFGTAVFKDDFLKKIK